MPGTVGTAALLGLMALRGVTGVTGAGRGSATPTPGGRWEGFVFRFRKGASRLRPGALARLREVARRPRGGAAGKDSGRGPRGMSPRWTRRGWGGGQLPFTDRPFGVRPVFGGGPEAAGALTTAEVRKAAEARRGVEGRRHVRERPAEQRPAHPGQCGERAVEQGTDRPLGQSAGGSGDRPGDRPGEFPPAPGGVTGTDVPAPSIPLQLHALQALCRQVFGFRLAMIAIGAPFSLSRTSDGPGAWLVGGAVLLTFLVSYVLLRDWERFGPVVLRHPVLLVGDALCLALLLLTATPDSPVGYAAVSTPLLGGLLYGWRGAGVFTGLQFAVLSVVQGVRATELETPASSLLLAGFCVAAGVVGVTLRNLMFRFGAAGLALSEARSRLAVSDALEAERARLAREMHDSVAKTLHGLALAADGLARSADRTNPEAVRRQAEQVADAARQAASESREVLSGLRHGPGCADGVDLTARLDAYAAEFTARTGLRVDFHRFDEEGPGGGEGRGESGGSGRLQVPASAALHALAVAAEAVENAHRHAEATRVDIGAGTVRAAGSAGSFYRVSIRDDGKGLPSALDLQALRERGHFGLIGMTERAARAGAQLRFGPDAGSGCGTEVRIELPVVAVTGRQAGDSHRQTGTTGPSPPGLL